ncbi:MAG TPA: cyclopropane-fatty-acyl-phospholipid synthase family protein [Desulfuromonadales bacterium]|nr:cyclopropane-fatty-acyl-phospholipid synthase family protein [Desulfuromonadales bacterium]
MHAASSDDRTVRRALRFLETLLAGYRNTPYAVRFWDGTLWNPGGGEPRFTLVLRHPGALRRMFLAANELTLGEAYIYDDFDVEGDLEAGISFADYLFELRQGLPEKLRNARYLLSLPARERPGSLRQAARLAGQAHSRERDSQAITYHYNVSNDFYRLWLDERLVYSCAYFAAPDDSLEAAQERKLDYLCRKLRLQPGERLLDLGCGWGGLILHAARHYGVEAFGITLSEPQAELANERIRAAGLAGRCRAEVLDYREVDEAAGFDKLVSVGMFEHVGQVRLQDYFAKAWRLLRPGGAFLNHGIAKSLARPLPEGPSFIDRYVFPDGELLPIATTLRTAESCGFEIRDLESLREHYLLTLRQWIGRLEASHEEAVRLTDEVTYRVWRLYMAACAYCFRTGSLNLYQALLVRPDGDDSRLPLTRADWYTG